MPNVDSNGNSASGQPSEFVRNVMVVLGGAAGAQLINLLAAPFLGRLYPPQAFGLAGSFQAIAQILMTVACGRYELAINLPESDGQARGIVGLAVLLSVVLAVAVGGAVWLLSPLWPHISALRELQPWLFALPAMTAIGGASLALTGWCNRRQEFGLLARNALLRSVVAIALSLVLGAAGWRAEGLILAFVASQGLGTGALWWTSRKSQPIQYNCAGLRDLRATAHRYGDFPKYLVPAGLVETACFQLPTLLLGTLFSMEVAGHFTFANRLINLPLNLLGKSFGDVFRQAASKAYMAEHQCEALFRVTAVRLAKMSIPLTLAMLVASPWAFEVAFGVQWREAGIYTSLLSVMFGARFVTSPLSVLLYIAEKQRWDLFLQLGLFALLLTGLSLASALHWTPRAAIALLGASFLAKYVVEFRLSRNLAVGRSGQG